MSRHTPPLLPPAVRHRTALPLLAILGLIAWLAPPLTADVIDDFSGPRKFRMFAVGGDPEWEVNGEMQLRLPQAGNFGAFLYWRTYDLPEQQPVEFRLDVVSLNAADTWAGLNVLFVGWPEMPRVYAVAYSLYWSQNGVVLEKSHGGLAGTWQFFDTGHSLCTQPVTMIPDLLTWRSCFA